MNTNSPLHNHNGFRNQLVSRQGTVSPTLAVAPPVPCEEKPTRILRLPEVITRVGLKRASIYLHMAAGSFPKQIPLGPRAVGWLESEIDSWLASRIKTRRTV